MVRGRDAAIVLGLAVGATVAVLLLTNLLRLSEDFDAAMAVPLAQRSPASSWLMPPELTQRPAGTAAAAGSLGSLLSRVARAQARRTPPAGTALTPAAPEPSPLVAAPGAAPKRLVALPRASAPPAPGPRRVPPQAPGRVTPRPAAAPPPVSSAVATADEPPPGLVAAPPAPWSPPASQSPPAPASPAQARPADDEGDDADDGDRGKGNGKAGHDPGDHGRSDKQSAKAAGQGLEPR